MVEKQQQTPRRRAKMVRKVVIALSLILLIGGLGYSEMPGGNFWVGIIEAFLGLGILMM